MLNPHERHELNALLGIDAATGSVPDDELLRQAAAALDLRGRVGFDPSGIVELVRGNLLVAVEALGPADAAAEDDPNNLRLSVYIDAQPEADRVELEAAGLLDPEEHEFQPNEKWLHAWWGAAILALQRNAGLVLRLDALGRAMDEAENVLRRKSWEGFTANLSSILKQD
ncbi:MAG: hypothetical protein L0271_03355 [Gemmatimonadetes bacterium]|nr:hypothetical protein [Gemmatimonadota bacterium]